MARRQLFCLTATFEVTEPDFVSPSEQTLSSQITVYQPEQGPEHDVKPHSMFQLEKVQTPILQLMQHNTHFILGLHSSYICILEVQTIDFVKQNFLYTLNNQDDIVIISKYPRNVNENL